MNKKFIKMSLIVCIPFLLLMGFYMMVVKDVEEGRETLPEDIRIEYKSYEEDKYDHIITITVKNRTRDIATIKDIDLSFNYKWDYKEEENWSSDGDFYFRGYEEDRYSEDGIYGIDSGTEKDVIFRIPKALNLDRDVFDLENPEIHYNLSLYKFRTGKSSLMFGAGGMGGSRPLKMNY